MIRTFWLFLVSIAASFLFAIAGAAAAPQLLGLVASNGAPTTLDCAGEDCSGYFGTFCLQPERQGPSRGTPYEIVAGGITLRLTLADGSERRLPAGPYVAIRAHNNYSAVRIVLLAEGVRAMGATAVAVEVGPNVTLQPVRQIGDLEPQTPEEIALAIGTLREAGALAFDRPGRIADASRIVSGFINALPKAGGETVAQQQSLWDRQADAPELAMATPEGRVLAREVYDRCHADLANRWVPSLRSCLSLQHGVLMRQINKQFWDLIGGT